MTTDTQLLPCPFCGANAHFEMDDARWEWVECESCGMQSNSRASLMEDCKPVLAEAWNTRVKLGQPTHSEKPVAWMRDWDVYDPSNSGPEFSHTKKKKSKGWVPLYTAPQPVEREPLTDEQWQRIADLTDSILTRATKDEIERVIGIKGGQHDQL